MANHQISKELNVEEMPADAATNRRAADCRTLELDIDASQATVLRQAVLSGRAVWVNKMLSMGADPLALGKDSRTALEVAEEMVSKCPGEDERREVLDLVKSSVKGGGSRKMKCPEVIGEVKDLIEKLEEGLVKMLSTELTSFKESKNDALNSISTEVTSMKESLDAVESGQTNLLSTVNTLLQASTVGVQEHANIVATMNAIHQSVVNVTREQASAMSSINALQLVIEDGKKEETSLVSKVSTSMLSLEEMKGEVHSIKQSHGEMKRDLNSIQQSNTNVNREVNSIKQTLSALKNDLRKTHDDVKGQAHSIRSSLSSLQTDFVRSSKDVKVVMNGPLEVINYNVNSIKQTLDGYRGVPNG